MKAGRKVSLGVALSPAASLVGDIGDVQQMTKNPQFFLEKKLAFGRFSSFPNEFVFSGATDCLFDFVVGFK